MVAPPSLTQSSFGQLPDGTPVPLFTLRNRLGTQVSVTPYGGIITSILTQDQHGQPGDIVCGFDNLQAYLGEVPYFGALIGRFANRIKAGRFALDGQMIQVSVNDADNHLHGGREGFDKKLWQVAGLDLDGPPELTLTLDSPHGDEGFPGQLQVRVTYSLSDTNELDVRFHAITDRPTVVNFTQHSYFNLGGTGDILDHRLLINADRFTPIDADLIPTGKLQPVADSPFDFGTAQRIGARIDQGDVQLQHGQGYDHNFVLSKPAPDALTLAAAVNEPVSGRTLHVYTTQPGLQFYSGNFLDGRWARGDTAFARRSAFCLEPQHFPDSPNQPHFPSTVLLPGSTFRSHIRYTFGVLPPARS